MRDGIPHQILLSPEKDPLRTLTLERLRLDKNAPVFELKSDADELLLYGLIGAVQVEATTADGQRLTTDLRPLRWRVDARGATALRLPAGQAWTATVRALDHSADYLLVRRQLDPVTVPLVGYRLQDPGRPPDAVAIRAAIPAPVVHAAHDDEVHQVGEGAYRREVRTFPTPEGYQLHCGETVNPPGHWSSWPRHRLANAMTREHQEVFLVITPGWGLLRRQGLWATGGDVDDVQVVHNGDALVMPLGSHPLVAAPESWLFYWWCYESTALKKTYNVWATDVDTYRS